MKSFLTNAVSKNMRQDFIYGRQHTKSHLVQEFFNFQYNPEEKSKVSRRFSRTVKQFVSFNLLKSQDPKDIVGWVLYTNGFLEIKSRFKISQHPRLYTEGWNQNVESFFMVYSSLNFGTRDLHILALNTDGTQFGKIVGSAIGKLLRDVLRIEKMDGTRIG